MRLARLLEAHDCAGLKELFHAFFASIPYQWYTNNQIADYEGFYASVVYSYFAGLGYEIAVEESSSHGRLDMAVRTGGHVYLFEFKVVEMAPPGAALTQLRERGYADKYRGGGEPIHLIGVEFSRETRNVTAVRGGGRLRAGSPSRETARGSLPAHRAAGEAAHRVALQQQQRGRNGVTAFRLRCHYQGYFVVHETPPSIRPRTIGSHGIYGSRSQMS